MSCRTLVFHLYDHNYYYNIIIIVVVKSDVSIGTVVGDTIANGIIKFYSFPFPTNGITLSLTVPSGYVNCYASDRYRNPNQYEYDWFVDVRNYWEIFLDPQVLMRPVGSFLYVSFLGVNPANVYQVNSSSGNILTVGESF